MVITGAQIVSIDSSEHVKLHEDILKPIIMNDQVKDLPVCVISVCGPPGSGKSVLIDFFLRYIRLKYRGVIEDEETGNQESTDDAEKSLISDKSQPLTRSNWAKGVENGILIWPEVLVCRAQNSRRIAVVFIETHGAFLESENGQWISLFVLSTMMSTVQIYNVGTELKFEHVRVLEMFYQYAVLAKGTTKNVALQKFQFVVRDWMSTKKAPLGPWGGLAVLEKMLKLHNKPHDGWTLLKKVKETFAEVGCFLLPNPSPDAGEADFNDINSINEAFIDKVNELVAMFTNPFTITEKQIGGQPLMTKDLGIYFKAYISEALNKIETPLGVGLMTASSMASHAQAKAEAVQMYSSQMLWLCSGELDLSSEALQAEHNHCKELALSHFTVKPKMGGDAFTDQYKREIEADLENIFNGCTRKNWWSRVRYHLINRVTITLLLVILIFSSMSVAMNAMGRKDHSKYALIVAELSIVLLLSWLCLNYRKI